MRHLIEEARRALHELNVGNTFENEKWRIHRYMSSIQITDLTHAGKRGKTCKELSLWGFTPSDEVLGSLVRLAKKNASPADMEKAARIIEGMGAKLQIRDLRGIDVRPGGFTNLSLVGKGVRIEAEYDTFRVVNEADEYNLTTCIPALTGGKKSIPVFYRWVRDNQAKIKKMTFGEVRKEMDRLGVKYHQYCAID